LDELEFEILVVLTVGAVIMAHIYKEPTNYMPGHPTADNAQWKRRELTSLSKLVQLTWTR
jgi:hypothetical protein